MKERPNTIIRRRDLLSFAIAGAGAAAASAMVLERAAANVDLTDSRKARSRTSSTEVRDFYRVNSYPAR